MLVLAAVPRKLVIIIAGRGRVSPAATGRIATRGSACGLLAQPVQLSTDQSGGTSSDPSAVDPLVAKLSAKSWISRLAYLVSRS